MKAKLEIVGRYSTNGSKLTSQEKPFFLILDVRKNQTKGKPGSFILAKKTNGTFENGRRDQYVSSVYPVPGQPFFRIEYQGNQYKFEFDQSGAVIQAWSQMALNNNSHL